MEGTAAQTALSLEQLAAELHELQLRVQKLEAGSTAEPAPPVATPPARVTPAPPAPDLSSMSSSMIPTLGKALLGVAGAYLLRAVAESAAIPPVVAVAAAVLYAAFWLVSASRVRGREGFAVTAYAITAAIAFCPMIFETASRFRVLPPVAAAALLAAFLISGAALSKQRDLPVICGITTLAGAGTAFALLFATQAVAPLTAALLAFAAVVEFAACRGHLFAVRWVAALSADLFVLALTQLTLQPAADAAPIPAREAILLQMALLAIYLGSTVYRTLALKIPMTNFEVGQSVVAFAIALGGALRIAHGPAAVTLGVLCVLGGIACYLVAFAVFEHHDRRRNFRVYAVFAVLLIFAAGMILFAGEPAASTLFWSVPAILTAAAARRIRSFTMVIHSAVYLIAASIVSGLFGYTSAAMIGAAAPAFPPSLLLAGVVTVTALCFALVPPMPALLARLSTAVIAALLLWACAGVAAAAGAALLGGSDYLLALRTALLCLAAMGLVWAAGRLQRRELLWVLYPLTAFLLYKLVADDFPHGRPATLAITLVLCGGVLILLPRRIRTVSGAPVR
jgi:hypothetical protein